MAMILNSPTPTTLNTVNMTTFRVLQGSHDGRIRFDSTSVGTGATNLIAGHTSDTNKDYMSFAMLTCDTIGIIPQGTVIDSAILHLISNTNRSGTTTTKMSFELTDNPALPTSVSDLRTKPRGSALTYTPSPNPYTTDNPFTVDLTSRVQTMINRSGWQSNKLLWIWEYAAEYAGDNTFSAVRSFDYGTDSAPYLTVEW